MCGSATAAATRRYLIAKEQIVKGRIGTLVGGAARVFNSLAGAGDPQAQSTRHPGSGRADLLRRPDELAARASASWRSTLGGQTGVLKSTGYDVTDLSTRCSPTTTAPWSISASAMRCEKYPALGHAARVEVLGTEGVMILDDDHPTS